MLALSVFLRNTLFFWVAQLFFFLSKKQIILLSVAIFFLSCEPGITRILNQNKNKPEGGSSHSLDFINSNKTNNIVQLLSFAYTTKSLPAKPLKEQFSFRFLPRFSIRFRREDERTSRRRQVALTWTKAEVACWSVLFLASVQFQKRNDSAGIIVSKLYKLNIWYIWYAAHDTIRT